MTPDAILSIANNVATVYPRAWGKAHREGDPEAWDYIILVGRALVRAFGADRVGCNWKRAQVSDYSLEGSRRTLSMDAISWQADDGTWMATDIIIGAGGHDPKLAWGTTGDIRDSGGQYVGAQGVADPYKLQTYFVYDTQPVPPPNPPVPNPPQLPPSVCKFTPPNFDDLRAALAAILNKQAELSRDMADLHRVTEETRQRVQAAEAAAQEIQAQLGRGFVIDASVRYLGPVRGTVRPS